MTLRIGIGKNLRIAPLGIPWNIEKTRLWYGVEFDVTVPTSYANRIAENNNMRMHNVTDGLPVQSLIKACVLNDNGTVNYYLDPDDWTKQEDGSASNLDGTDGQVMIEIPAYYQKFERSGNTIRAKLCLSPQDGFTFAQKFYLSPWRSVLHRTDLKMASVKTMSANYRGGNNTAAWDGTYRTLLGKPVTSLTLANARSYAEKRGVGWCIYPYACYSRLFWLYIIEYGNRNEQLAVNSSLSPDGYRQGGLGDGVTTLNSVDWNTYNTVNPVIPIGTTDSLASRSGEVAYSIPSFPGATGNVKICRYRGIEQPWGELINMLDGVNIQHVQNVSTVAYIVDNYKLFAASQGTSNNARDPIDIFAGGGANDGTIQDINLGTLGDVMPKAVVIGSGAYTKYFCSVYWSALVNLNVSEWKLGFGNDNGYEGKTTGFANLHSWPNASTSRNDLGMRLTFMETMPSVTSIRINNATPTKVEINFNLPLNTNVITGTGAFAVTGKIVTSVSVGQYKVTLTVNSAITGGSLILVTYTPPVFNKLVGSDYESYVNPFSIYANNLVNLADYKFNTDGNTKIWLDFTDDTTITKDAKNLVTKWADKLASGNDPEPVASTVKPTIDNTDSMKFAGVGQLRKIFAFARPGMFYFVIKANTWTALDQIVATQSGGLTWMQKTGTPGVTIQGGAESALNNDLTLGSWHIVRIKMKSGGAFSKIQVDKNAATSGNYCYNDFAGMSIGGSMVGGALSDISIREVIARAVDESVGDETTIYNYLATKYGFPTI